MYIWCGERWWRWCGHTHTRTSRHCTIPWKWLREHVMMWFCWRVESKLDIVRTLHLAYRLAGPEILFEDKNYLNWPPPSQKQKRKRIEDEKINICISFSHCMPDEPVPFNVWKTTDWSTTLDSTSTNAYSASSTAHHCTFRIQRQK